MEREGYWDDDNFDWLRVLEISEKLLGSPDPLRKQLGQHLELVSEALRAIKKVENGDFRQGEDIAPIQAVIGSEKENTFQINS